MFKETVKGVWYWLAQLGCRIFCLVFFQIRVYGRENVPDKGAFLLVSNHQSYLDPVFCGVALKRQVWYIARDSLFENRFFSRLIASLNAIPVKRDKPNVSAMKKVISKLNEGWGVCLFPEGTRTNDGKIAPFKRGFGLICKREEAAVVPVLIDGAFECWPRHKKMFSPGKVLVFYGKTLTPEQTKSIGETKLAKYLTDILRQMQSDCRVKRGKKPYDY